jgi:DNA-directed RNA polymerase specialized sigma24 family protein
VTFASGLAVNECCEISPWAGRKLVRWSARRRYAANPERAEIRATELAALIDARPGKLFKLLTACGFTAAALGSQVIALLRRTERADDGTASAAILERGTEGRLLAGERAADLRKALSELPEGSQQLLQMFTTDPPATYAEISDRLGLPVGMIGPTRGQCLDMLRRLLTGLHDDEQGFGDIG